MLLRVSNATESGHSQRFLCAQCGDALVAPEWSEHVSECCVRHRWSCEACGYACETSIYLRAEA